MTNVQRGLPEKLRFLTLNFILSRAVLYIIKYETHAEQKVEPTARSAIFVNLDWRVCR